eukprot:tig00021244_g19582.t1
MRWLIDFGAVWLRGKERLASQDAEREVEAKVYVRAHLNPKRFPVGRVDWRAAIVHAEEGFVVVDKPPGVPCHANSDNARENVCEQVAAVLGEAVFVTSRLDQPTRGLLVLARTRDFLSRFNLLLRKHKVRKRYRVLAAAEAPETPADEEASGSPGPADRAGGEGGAGASAGAEGPPLGPMEHWMEECPRAPKRVARAPRSGWLPCHLTVLASRRVLPGEVARRWGRPAAEAAASWANRGGGELERPLFEIEIELGTGRTHQIRAQLSHEGYPIFGDFVYGFGEGGGEEEAARTLEERARRASAWPLFGLQCCGLAFKRPGRAPGGGERLALEAPDAPDDPPPSTLAK